MILLHIAMARIQKECNKHHNKRDYENDMRDRHRLDIVSNSGQLQQCTDKEIKDGGEAKPAEDRLVAYALNAVHVEKKRQRSQKNYQKA